MLVTELLKNNARLYPDQEALVAVETGAVVPFDEAAYRAARRCVTWSQFNGIANQVANYYRAQGLGPGSKVAILLMNCLEWLPLYFGILKAGAVAVPLNFRYTSADIVRNAAFVEAEALVFGTYSEPAVTAALPALTGVRSFIYLGEADRCPAYAQTWEACISRADETEPAQVPAPEQDAAIYFSSGTTGAPKAVVYTHRTLEGACLMEHGNHHQTHGDVFICIPPLYHVGAKLHWTGNLLMGAKGVLLMGFRVEPFFETMWREGVTIAFLLLPWVQDILFSLDSGTLDPGRYDLAAWRMLHMGAQPIPPSVVRRIRAAFPQLDCEVSYGLTEAGGPGCLNLSADRMDKLGSVGVPTSGWEARIVDPRGADVPAGEIGQLLLRSDHMMRCYYRDPDTTAAALEGGWLHTGDLARTDGDGFYYIVGRMKDIIISGGENIYPVQIEDFIRTHEVVEDVAVFGLCDCRLGEAVAAQIQLKPGSTCSEEEMREFCARLPRYQRPGRFFFGEVPRNPTGKIDKVALRKKYSPPHPFSSHAPAEKA